MIYDHSQIGFWVILRQRFVLPDSHRCRTGSGEPFHCGCQTWTAKNQCSRRSTDPAGKLSGGTYDFARSATDLPVSLFYESEDVCHINDLLCICVVFFTRESKSICFFPK
jgi:hypothetical protein